MKDLEGLGRRVRRREVSIRISYSTGCDIEDVNDGEDRKRMT